VNDNDLSKLYQVGQHNYHLYKWLSSVSQLREEDVGTALQCIVLEIKVEDGGTYPRSISKKTSPILIKPASKLGSSTSNSMPWWKAKILVPNTQGLGAR